MTWVLSISKPFKGAGRADYYLNLAREDYYLGGMEPPGFWLGEAAKHFGLQNEISGDAFRNLLAGYDAKQRTGLVHNAGSPNRRSGWDLTWSVPKSVSVAWSQATPVIRAVIESEVRASVRRGIAYLEGIGVVSRRGTDGVVHEKAKMLFAAFEHSTSRAQDPQLHIHTILINVGVRDDGSTGTLDPRLLYRHQLTAGALFRAELAARLERSLGLRARREGRCFELVGVPATLIEEFSKRRAQIEARLKELGVFTPQAAEMAAFDTRPKKEQISREELFPRWHHVGREFNWSTKELGWVLKARSPARDQVAELARASQAALLSLTQQQSHFSSRQLLQALAEQAQGRGLDADAVITVRTQLLSSPSVVPLSSPANEQRWTTPEMLAMERRVLAVAESMREGERILTESKHLPTVIAARYPHLSGEQMAALFHVTSAERGIRAVSGLAGTGKSTLFKAANEVWRQQGREVIGACLAGKAALELTEATGIPSQTLHRTLTDFEGGRLRLTERSILLVDEAGMVGTRQMRVLLDHCAEAKATLVLAGDHRQLQSIEAGGVFRELAERFGAATLQEIKRQREAWAQAAVKALAEGNSAEALREFAGRGLLTLSDSHEQASVQLLADWRKQAINDPASSVILAVRNSDVVLLNHFAQQERLAAGHLKGLAVCVGATTLFAGDRILFTRNCPVLKVCNGVVASVVEATADRVVARLESGREVQFAPRAYPHVQLAYALTTCKAQGMTVERAFVYVDETVESREAAYVQASRARGLCSLYATTDSMPELAAAMARSRPKTMATTLLPESERHPVLTLRLAC